jgi:hypothetical protein
MHHVRMGLANFVIGASGDGTVELLLNGHDLTDRIQSLQLDATANNLPQLRVTLTGEGQVAGEGIVQVIQTAEDVAVDLGHIVRAWLDEIDANALMEDAMRNAPMHASAGSLLLAELSERAKTDFQ